MFFRFLAVLMLLPAVAIGKSTPCNAFGDNAACYDGFYVPDFEVVSKEAIVVNAEKQTEGTTIKDAINQTPKKSSSIFPEWDQPCGPMFDRNANCEGCKDCVKEPIYVRNYKGIIDPSYAHIHRECKDFAPINFEHVDFRIKKGNKFSNYVNKLGNYRFRIFGCRRNQKEMFLNVGRTMQKDMDFFEVFNEVYGQCIPQQKMPLDLCNPYSTEAMPEYVLTAEITDYAMNVCDEFDWKTATNKEERSGSSEMTVVWRLMDVSKQNVYWKGTSTGYAKTDDGTINGEVFLVEEAFRDALTQLRYLDGFETQISTRQNMQQKMDARKMLADLENAINPAKCAYAQEIIASAPLENVVAEIIDEDGKTQVAYACPTPYGNVPMVTTEVIDASGNKMLVSGCPVVETAPAPAPLETKKIVEKSGAVNVVAVCPAAPGQKPLEVIVETISEDGVVSKVATCPVVAPVVVAEAPKPVSTREIVEESGVVNVVAMCPAAAPGQKPVEIIVETINEDGTVTKVATCPVMAPVETQIAQSTIITAEVVDEEGNVHTITSCPVLAPGQSSSVITAEVIDENGNIQIISGCPVIMPEQGAIITAEVVDDHVCTAENGCGPVFVRNKPCDGSDCGPIFKRNEGCKDGSCRTVFTRNGTCDGDDCGPIFKRNEGCDSLSCRLFGDKDVKAEEASGLTSSGAVFAVEEIDEASGMDSFGNVDNVRFIESDWVDIYVTEDKQDIVETAYIESSGGFCIENELVYKDMNPYNVYKTRASIVEITSLSGQKAGVGLIINDQFILTSANLIGKDDNNFNVKTINGVEFGATGFRFSPSKNVALLLADEKVQYTPLPLELNLPPVGSKGFMTLGMNEQDGGVEGYVDADTSIEGYRFSKDKGAEIITNQHTQSLTVGGALVDSKGNIYGIAHYGKRYDNEPDMYMPIEVALKSLSVELCGRDFLNQAPWKKSSVESAKQKAPEEMKEVERK